MPQCCTQKRYNQMFKVGYYYGCPNCGTYKDESGKIVLIGQSRCPSSYGHHLGDLCVTCGNDERKIFSMKYLSTEELAAERQKLGLSPESDWREKEEKKLQIKNRIVAGELLNPSEYFVVDRK